MNWTAYGLVLALAAPAAGAGEGAMVPFVIPHGPQTDSPIRRAQGPIPADKRVVVRGGHFFVGSERLRVWGVNTCFGANFPTHRDAERIAARMAAFGINSVRFHHMDSAHFPRGIWDKADPMKLSAEALDRLDYFIDRLARHGIYANINLHVSRTHSRYLKLPDRDKLRNYDKIVDIFTPELIAAQKRYARALLGHVNKYRKLRYADDPAVAFVEINNEDSLFMWGAQRDLTTLPPYYAKILQGKFAEWLKVRYGTTARLRAGWGKGAAPLGANVLEALPGKLPGKSPWFLGQHLGSKGRFVRIEAGGRVEVTRPDATGWHIQLIHGGLAVEAGKYYTVSFRARADKPRKIDYNVGHNHEPWGMLGLVSGANLSRQWRTFRVGFVASADDDNARLCFQLGGSDVAVELADIRLMPGGREGLAEGESIEAGNVAVFADSETDARMDARWRFLAETEKAYFDGMYAFLKDDLGVKSLVTGTIVFGPCGLYGQSGMDYIDGHAYWQHPRFPGRAWDPGNWTVEQKAMVDSPAEATLLRLAAQRLDGKPYTVSEYNHPAPNDYQAECVPMVASFAAAQDWDGVWLFAYSHRTDDVERDSFTSFFDLDANPAKWGFVPAGAVIFREAGIEPIEGRTAPSLPSGAAGLTQLTRKHRKHGRDLRKAWEMSLSEITGLSQSTTSKFTDLHSAGEHLGLRQGTDGKGGLMWAAGPKALVIVQHAVNPDKFAPSDVPTSPDFWAATFTSMDGQAFWQSRKLLLTICGRCENTGMKFSADRRTVGRNWGTGPVRIEPASGPFPSACLAPTDKAQWRCQALGPDGRATADVPIKSGDDNSVIIEVSPKYKTMWYLLTRK